MKTSKKNIDEIFTFKGEWGIESKCGFKKIEKEGKVVVIVTELYQDNPGSSVTSVAASLAEQICEKYSIDLTRLIYIESTPEMNSKLKFYDENYYLVHFDIDGGKLKNPQWSKLGREDIKKYV